MIDIACFSFSPAVPRAAGGSPKQARKGSPSELLPSSLAKNAGHALQRALKGRHSELLRSSLRRETGDV